MRIISSLALLSQASATWYNVLNVCVRDFFSLLPYILLQKLLAIVCLLNENLLAFNIHKFYENFVFFFFFYRAYNSVPLFYDIHKKSRGKKCRPNWEHNFNIFLRLTALAAGRESNSPFHFWSIQVRRFCSKTSTGLWEQPYQWYIMLNFAMDLVIMLDDQSFQVINERFWCDYSV